MEKNLEYFGNDSYKLLCLLSEIEVEVKGLKYIPLLQQEIADKVFFSKLKVNKLMQELLSKGYLANYKEKKSKYCITEQGYKVLEKMKNN